jgi:hypothetical protein
MVYPFFIDGLMVYPFFIDGFHSVEVVEGQKKLGDYVR